LRGERQQPLHQVQVGDLGIELELQLVLDRRHLARGVLAPGILGGAVRDRHEDADHDERDGEPGGEADAAGPRFRKGEERERHEEEDADRVAHPPREPVGPHSVNGMSPESHRAPAPTLAETRHDTGPLMSSSGTALRTLVSTRPDRSTGRARLAQSSAWSATPPAITSATTMSAARRGSPGWYEISSDERYQLKRNDPSSTPARAAGPR
jgi:hypothetical protein